MMNKTPAMILYELSIKLTRSVPLFNTVSLINGLHENVFICRVEVLGVDTTAKGHSKKEAKQVAARKALTILKQMGIYKPDEQVIVPSEDDDYSELKKVINYKGKLMDICLNYNIQTPEYVEISAVGPPHAREFTYECHLGNTMITKAKASTKKKARQIVSREMIAKIKDIAPAIAKELQDERFKMNDGDQKVNEMYHKVTKLGKNLGISTYNQRLREIMKGNEITSEDLKVYFELPHNEEKLERLLNRLDLKYAIIDITGELDQFKTVIVEVNLDCPLTSIGQSTNIAAATKEAIDSLFSIMRNLTE